MRKLMSVLCLAGLVGFVLTPCLRADDAAPAQPKPAEVKKPVLTTGVVKSIAKDGSFVIPVKSGEKVTDVTVKVDAKTAYHLDGKASTAAAVVKVGGTVTATHIDGLASRVDATTPKPVEAPKADESK